MIAALGAAFALAGCGRKAGLDPPPSAAVSPAPPTNQPSLGENTDPSMTGFNRAPSAKRVESAPTTPAPADKRSFLLDFLIK
jgi:predicted small lipoprotein YifL